MDGRREDAEVSIEEKEYNQPDHGRRGDLGYRPDLGGWRLRLEDGAPKVSSGDRRRGWEGETEPLTIRRVMIGGGYRFGKAKCTEVSSFL